MDRLRMLVEQALHEFSPEGEWYEGYDVAMAEVLKWIDKITNDQNLSTG